jgi:hypothetical protein
MASLFILFVMICTVQLMDCHMEYSRRRRRRRIIPIGSANWARRVIRLREIRRQMYEVQLEKHYKQQEKVNTQIKNTVIFINPDNTIQIGFKEQTFHPNVK